MTYVQKANRKTERVDTLPANCEVGPIEEVRILQTVLGNYIISARVPMVRASPGFGPNTTSWVDLTYGDDSLVSFPSTFPPPPPESVAGRKAKQLEQKEEDI